MQEIASYKCKTTHNDIAIIANKMIPIAISTTLISFHNPMRRRSGSEVGLNTGEDDARCDVDEYNEATSPSSDGG
jgi:hypothetical protein